jgi:hypothetical protein
MTTNARPDSQTQSLKGIFNAFAEDALRRFPHLRGHLVIVNAEDVNGYLFNTTDPRKTNGYDGGQLTALLRGDPLFQEAARNAGIPSRVMQGVLSGENVGLLTVILSNERLDPARDTRESVSPETRKHISMVFNHELAHTAIQNAFYTGRSSLHDVTLAESIADAYALIRHYQTYGTDDPHENAYISEKSRAISMLRDDDLHAATGHFSFFTLQALRMQKDAIDFARLTPEQTAELARQFALRNTPPAAVLAHIHETFARARLGYTVSTECGKRTVADIALSPDTDTHTFAFAKYCVSQFLAHDRKTGYQTPEREKHWRSIARQIKQQSRLHDEGAIYTLCTPETACRKGGAGPVKTRAAKQRQALSR